MLYDKTFCELGDALRDNHNFQQLVRQNLKEHSKLYIRYHMNNGLLTMESVLEIISNRQCSNLDYELIDFMIDRDTIPEGVFI